LGESRKDRDTRVINNEADVKGGLKAHATKHSASRWGLDGATVIGERTEDDSIPEYDLLRTGLRGKWESERSMSA